jgi:hypothetical protein
MTEPENYAAAVRGELRAAQALASHLMDGAQLLGEERQQIADALRTALNLADRRIVPTDAIVLPALTAEATADLELLLDTDLSQDITPVEDENGHHEVDILHACPSCDRVYVDSLTPDQADTYAGLIAVAAAEARANTETPKEGAL